MLRVSDDVLLSVSVPHAPELLSAMARTTRKAWVDYFQIKSAGAGTPCITDQQIAAYFLPWVPSFFLSALSTWGEGRANPDLLPAVNSPAQAMMEAIFDDDGRPVPFHRVALPPTCTASGYTAGDGCAFSLDLANLGLLASVEVGLQQCEHDPIGFPSAYVKCKGVECDYGQAWCDAADGEPACINPSEECIQLFPSGAPDERTLLPAEKNGPWNDEFVQSSPFRQDSDPLAYMMGVEELDLPVALHLGGLPSGVSCVNGGSGMAMFEVSTGWQADLASTGVGGLVANASVSSGLTMDHWIREWSNWVVSPFTPCECSGISTRQVECRSSNGQLPEANCTDPKPSTERECPLRYCHDSFTFSTTVELSHAELATPDLLPESSQEDELHRQIESRLTSVLDTDVSVVSSSARFSCDQVGSSGDGRRLEEVNSDPCEAVNLNQAADPEGECVGANDNCVYSPGVPAVSSICVATHVDACTAIGIAGTSPGNDCTADARCEYADGGTPPSCVLTQATVDACTAIGDDSPDSCNSEASCTYDIETSACGTTTAESTCTDQATSGETACIGAGDCTYQSNDSDDMCEPQTPENTCTAESANGDTACTGAGDCTYQDGAAEVPAVCVLDAPEVCAVDQAWNGESCEACEGNTANPAGSAASGNPSSCTLCAVDFYWNGDSCEACADGQSSSNLIASGDANSCTPCDQLHTVMFVATVQSSDHQAGARESEASAIQARLSESELVVSSPELPVAYDYIITAGTCSTDMCPIECGAPATSAVDSYTCERDGIAQQSHELCEQHLGSPAPVTVTVCCPSTSTGDYNVSTCVPRDTYTKTPQQLRNRTADIIGALRELDNSREAVYDFGCNDVGAMRGCSSSSSLGLRQFVAVIGYTDLDVGFGALSDHLDAATPRISAMVNGVPSAIHAVKSADICPSSMLCETVTSEIPSSAVPALSMRFEDGSATDCSDWDGLVRLQHANGTTIEIGNQDCSSLRLQYGEPTSPGWGAQIWSGPITVYVELLEEDISFSLYCGSIPIYECDNRWQACSGVHVTVDPAECAVVVDPPLARRTEFAQDFKVLLVAFSAWRNGTNPETKPGGQCEIFSNTKVQAGPLKLEALNAFRDLPGLEEYTIETLPAGLGYCTPTSAMQLDEDPMRAFSDTLSWDPPISFDELNNESVMFGLRGLGAASLAVGAGSFAGRNPLRNAQLTPPFGQETCGFRTVVQTVAELSLWTEGFRSRADVVKTIKDQTSMLGPSEDQIRVDVVGFVSFATSSFTGLPEDLLASFRDIAKQSLLFAAVDASLVALGAACNVVDATSELDGFSLKFTVTSTGDVRECFEGAALTGRRMEEGALSSSTVTAVVEHVLQTDQPRIQENCLSCNASTTSSACVDDPTEFLSEHSLSCTDLSTWSPMIDADEIGCDFVLEESPTKVAVRDACPLSCGGCSPDGSFLVIRSGAFDWTELVSNQEFTSSLDSDPDILESASSADTISVGPMSSEGTMITTVVTTVTENEVGSALSALLNDTASIAAALNTTVDTAVDTTSAPLIMSSNAAAEIGVVGTALESAPPPIECNSTGMYWDEQCMYCEPGRVDGDNNVLTECTACGPGTSADQTVCTPCIAGRSGSGPGQCEDCAAGFYQSGSGADSCERCESGSTAVRPGMTRCEACEAGKADTDNDGSTDCEACPAGKHQTVMGQTECPVCPLETFSATEGSDTCEPCPNMRISSATTCFSCATGHDSIADEMVTLWGDCPEACSTDEYLSDGECQRCATGKQLNAGHSGCIECESGSISPDGLQCTSCGEGMVPNERQSECECKQGRRLVEDDQGNKRCDPCPRGQFTTDGKDCHNCPSRWTVPANIGFDANGDVDTGDVTVDGGNLCVSCQLDPEQMLTMSGSTTVDGDRYPFHAALRDETNAVDWDLCNENSVLCAPGQERDDESMSGCTNCTTGQFSPLGITCERCPYGTIVSADQSVCTLCEAGKYHAHVPGDIGTCEPCTGNKISREGQTGCTTDCPPGQEPNVMSDDLVPPHSKCVACQTGKISKFNTTCYACPSGKQPDATRQACEGCDIVSAGAMSSDGTPCIECSVGFQPDQSRTQCDPCEEGTIGIVGGICANACETMLCSSSISLTAYEQDGDTSAALTLSDLCSIPDWLYASGSLSLTDSDGEPSECEQYNPCRKDLAFIGEGRSHNLTVNATVDGRSSTCVVNVHVGEAKLIAGGGDPLECTTTGFAETTYTLLNGGTEPVIVTALAFNVSWAQVESVRIDGVPQRSLRSDPLSLPPAKMATVVVRATGSAAEPPEGAADSKVHYGQGIATSSIGDVTFDMQFTVKATTLRIMVLPSTIPEQTLTAGDITGSRSTYLAVYNVDALYAMTYVIDNCIEDWPTLIGGGSNQTVAFGACESPSSLTVEVGKSHSVRVNFFAPKIVATYHESYTVTSQHNGEATSWTVESTVTVVAAEADATMSSASLQGVVTAGQPANFNIHPRDRFGNAVSGFHFGLDFTATATQAGASLPPFNSDYSFAEQAYQIEAVFPKYGSYDVTIKLDASSDDVTTPEAMRCNRVAADEAPTECNPFQVQSIECDDPVRSEPNVDGNKCTCKVGFARIPDSGLCSECDAGQQPPTGSWLARERGCNDCPVGKFSERGFQECMKCPIGKQPNSDNTGCEECGDSKYFKINKYGIGECARCAAGYRINSAATGGFVEDGGDCVSCSGLMGHYGPADPADKVGMCFLCPDGTQPGPSFGGDLDVYTQCHDCEAGRAGKGGVCDQCPAGKEGKLPTNKGTECTICIGTVSENGDACKKCHNGYQPAEMIGAVKCIHCSSVNVTAVNGTVTISNLTRSLAGEACAVCPAGTEPDTNHFQCAKCPHGKYSDGQSHRCQRCSPGHQVNEQQSGCMKCEGLGYSEAGEACKDCARKDGLRPNDNRHRCEAEEGHFQLHGQVLPCKDWAASDASYNFPVGMKSAHEVSSGKFKWTCPGAIHSTKTKEGIVPHTASEYVGGSSHRNAPIYPAPGYWIHGDMPFEAVATQLPECTDCTEEEVNALVRKEMIEYLPELKCPGDGAACVGTVTDRDWTAAYSETENRTLVGLEYKGYCKGDLTDEAYQTECKILTASTHSCVEAPYFCAAHHAGRFCAYCVDGTRKLSSGECCNPNVDSYPTLADLSPLFLPMLLSAWIFRKCVTVKASDTVISTFTFMLQVLKLVGVEKGWAMGFPFVGELIDALTGIFSMDYPPVPTSGPCDVVSCGFWGGLELFGVQMGGVIGHFYATAILKPLLMAGSMWCVVLLYRQHRLVEAVQKVSLGLLFKDSPDVREEQRNYTFALYHRCLLGVFEFCFMPATFACLNILLPKYYMDYQVRKNGTFCPFF
jgi:hypothetical protein